MACALDCNSLVVIPTLPKREGKVRTCIFLLLIYLSISAACAQDATDLWVEMREGSAVGEGISSGIGDSGWPAIAIGSDGYPIICWQTNCDYSPAEIYVKRWNGSAWVEIGKGSASGGGISNTARDSS